MIRIILAILICVAPCNAADFRQVVGYSRTVGAAHAIEDDFSSDTSSNYTVIYGGISVSGGTAGGTSNWTTNRVYHSSSLESANQDVQADIIYDGSNDSAGLVVRFNPTNTTGYHVYLSEGSIQINSFNTANGIGTFVGSYSGGYTSGTYTVRVTINGSSIVVYVGGSPVITTSDSTYSSGNYCGLQFRRAISNTDVRADNFIGDSI